MLLTPLYFARAISSHWLGRVISCTEMSHVSFTLERVPLCGTCVKGVREIRSSFQLRFQDAVFQTENY